MLDSNKAETFDIEPNDGFYIDCRAIVKERNNTCLFVPQM